MCRASPPASCWRVPQPTRPEFTECRAGLAQYAGLAPQLMAIHEMAADEADECRLLLLQSFANVTLQSNARVPEYEEWLYGADFAPVYRRYRDNLRLIGLGNEARWILKDPSHLWAPRALLQTFPAVDFDALVFLRRTTAAKPLDPERIY